MRGFFIEQDQMVKREQYKDLLREATHYRLIKAAVQPGSKPSRQSAGALRNALGSLSQHLPWPGLISDARI
jgi:hypothetical protein